MDQLSFLEEKVVYINKEENNNVVKENFARYGAEKLDDISLVSIILGSKVGCILKNNDLNTLFKMDIKSEKELRNIGLERSSILKLKALLSLCKRGTKIDTTESLNSAEKVAGLCEDLVNIDQEIFRLICVNTKNELIHQEDVFKGSLDTSIVHPREILKIALQCSAASIFIVHNHPSGNTEPSNEDIGITNRIKEASKIIGIDLLDHIIVAKKGYFSFKRRGCL